MKSTSRYYVVGPRGEGPLTIDARDTLEAATKARMGYAVDQPRGVNGQVIGYERVNEWTWAKVGPFAITWLGWVR